MARHDARNSGHDGEHGDETVPEFRPRDNQVLIRMYGQGLGDCFLLAFPRTRPTTAVTTVDADRPVYVLIDCGVMKRTSEPGLRMERIIQDIRRTTRDDSLSPIDGTPRGHLDLLIITHEHWDHVSGFIYKEAKDEWDKIQVDAVWTSWVAKDDPEGLAGVLQKIVDQQERALAEVGRRAQRFGLEDDLLTVLTLNEFLSESESGGLGFAAATTRSGLDFAKGLAQEDPVICDPGEVRPVPGSDAAAYILGPPQDWPSLRKMNPTARDPETFVGQEDGGAPADHGLSERDGTLALRRVLTEPSWLTAFATPLLDPPPPGTEEGADPDAAMLAEWDLYERSFPFDRTFGVSMPAAEAEATAQAERYPALSSYFDDVNHWRRIDFDWLMAAEAFAIEFNSFINNTSLALAFELPAAAAGADRKVLLFVADAQVGNWLSWDEIGDWKPRDGVKAAQTTANMPDLFQRTVFYKVGHHGSHNATLKAKGVERMRADGELTAFVPVSAPVARLHGWDEMPLPELLDALAERTKHRVVLANGNVWPPVAVDQLAAARRRIGVQASRHLLGEKVDQDEETGDVRRIEDEVPLWVQIAVDY